jgi:hypothetical protein
MKIAGHYARRLFQTKRRYPYLILLFFILLLLVEEYYVGYLRISWKKRYSHTVFLPITVRREPDGNIRFLPSIFWLVLAPRIAIVSVIYDDRKLAEYLLAETSVACYAAAHKYTFIKLNLKDEPNLLDKCPGKDVSLCLEFLISLQKIRYLFRFSENELVFEKQNFNLLVKFYSRAS